MALGRNLDDGDALTLQIANADGEVVASAQLEVEPVRFRPIKANGERIGTDRLHVAAIQ